MYDGSTAWPCLGKAECRNEARYFKDVASIIPIYCGLCDIDHNAGKGERQMDRDARSPHLKGGIAAEIKLLVAKRLRQLRDQIAASAKKQNSVMEQGEAQEGEEVECLCCGQVTTPEKCVLSSVPGTDQQEAYYILDECLWEMLIKQWTPSVLRDELKQ